MAHPHRIEPEQSRRRGGCAEVHAQVWVEWVAACGARIAERHGEACADVVAERHRAQEVGTAAVGELGDRERGRDDAAARMVAAAQMRVVGLVGMSGHGVGKRRAFDWNQQRRPDQSRFGGTAEALHIVDGQFAGLEPRSRHDGGERIQDVVGGLFRHRRR